MKIRLILLTLAGVAIYIVLANFHSNMVKEASVSKEHTVPGKEATPAKEAPPVKSAQAPVAAPQEAAIPAPKQLEPATEPQKKSAPDQVQPPSPEPPAVHMTEVSPAASAPELAKLRAELVQRDTQIRQLIDAQESIAIKYRALVDASEAGAAAADTKDQALKENEGRIKALAADKEKVTAELQQAMGAIAQLRQEMEQLKTAEAQTRDSLLQKNADQLKALVADKEKVVAELQRTNGMLEQLRQQVDQLQSAGAKTEAFLKEKETLLNSVQTQVQERTGETTQLKSQLAETVDKLTAAKTALEQTERKAEELIRLSAEKEQIANALVEQKASLELALAEKTDFLDKSILAIQALKQEVAAQPQAVATVQGLLDERIREFDHFKQETAAKIEQLNKQLADTAKNESQAIKERDRFKAEAESARKKVEELEALQQQTHSALAEADKKLAAALESKNSLQAQFSDKDAALNAVQAQISELAAKNVALGNERIGLTSQLEALQADHASMLAMKASFETQAAALTKAEGQLKEMAALQAKLEQLNQTLTEKNAALDMAAKQGEELAALQAQLADLGKQVEAGGATQKQLEQEKSDLAGQLAAAQAINHNVETLKKAVDEKDNALTAAEIKIKELTAVSEKVAGLETKVAAVETAKQVAEKKAGDCEAASKKLNESLTTTTGKIKTLEGELSVAQTRIKELTDKNQLQAQQDLVPNLNQQIATLRDQIGQMEASSTQAKKAAADAIAVAQAKQDAAEAASKKTVDLQTENQKLQQLLQASQETINTLQKQLEATKIQPPVASTPAAAPADKPAAVAAPDADKDGVADATDLCPGSPAGSPVNLLGCPAQKGIVLEGVQFKSGTAALTPASQKILDQTAAALKQAGQVAFEVAGYTDNIGDARLNQTLSNQRAQAVISYMAGKGVAPARMSAKGYGADKPIADNATAEGRQKNRRIELHLAEN